MTAVIDPAVAHEMLSRPRIAVVGASDDPRNFGRTVYRELRSRGVDAVAVNPHAEQVDGDPCYADLASVPDEIDTVIVMVHRDRAADVVRACASLGIERVWLFQGVGGAGAASAEALEICERLGITVVAGACPLMFLEPVGVFHKLHRAIRRLNGSVARPAPGTSGVAGAA